MTVTIEGVAHVEVSEAYPEDKVWKVEIDLDNEFDPEGLNRVAEVKKGSGVRYALETVTGWTDEPVDANQIVVVAHNDKEYTRYSGDSENLPDSVQFHMLDKARDTMFEVSEALKM